MEYRVFCDADFIGDAFSFANLIVYEVGIVLYTRSSMSTIEFSSVTSQKFYVWNIFILASNSEKAL